MKIPMKLVYQHMAIFLIFSPTSNHLHPLQVENCDSNSQLVVDEDGNGKFRLERVNRLTRGNAVSRLAFDAGPTLKRHWVKAPGLLGYAVDLVIFKF